MIDRPNVLFSTPSMKAAAMINFHLKRFLVPCILALATTHVAGATELPQELIKCRALASAVARLDCYDQFIDRDTSSKQQKSNAVAPEHDSEAAVALGTNTIDGAAEVAGDISQEALFGKNAMEMRKSVQKATATDEIDRIEARISKMRLSAAGKAIITLANGQVWLQIDSSSARLSADDRVIIRRASLGSFMLNKVGNKKSIRVKRIS